MSDTKFHILGLCGSLRRDSYNLALLKAAAEFLPEKVGLDIYDGLGELPLYNEDLHITADPEPVHRLKQAVRACNVLLIATPEYNYGIPAPLKNAIDWVAMLPQENPLRNKAVGIMGVSTGGFGTVRAQLSLRQTLLSTESLVMLKPELLVANAAKCFDEEKKLTDAAMRERMRHFILSLLLWSKKAAVLSSKASV
jgi:chromate reductase